MANPDFDALNRQIREAGADWVAGETSRSAYFDQPQREAGSLMGLALAPADALAALTMARSAELTAFATAVVPPAIDWRNHRSQNWVTGVKDQGSCGSCVAFATCATLESAVLINRNSPGAAFDLSEAHLFYCGTPNACATGWYPDKALSFATVTGVGPEAAFPYVAGNQPCRPVAPAVKALGQSVAASTIARKSALTKGPVIGCFAVYQDFMTYRSGVYRHVTGSLLGYHAVSVIGYDDARGCWIAKNSWSAGWGMNGFFDIGYGECGIDGQFGFYYPTGVALQPGATV